MGRTGFVVQRLLLLIPVAVGVTIIVFFMVHLIPGDPAATILRIHADPKAVALLHQQWGLNRPLASEYWLFVDRLLHGNLGQSICYGGSVTSLILSHLPPTLWLLTYATVLTVLISVPLAVLAASRRDGVRDHVVRAVPLVGLGMPQFWLGFLLIYVFAISLHIFPVSGYGSGFTGHLQSMFLPSLTVALALTPVVIRSLRASMLNVLTAEYIVTARSKGVSSRRLFLRHVLRNAVILAVVVGLALAAPLITSYNPIAQNLNESLLGPSAHHLLGTDQLGRDTFTRLLYGLRLDLRIAFLAVLFPFVLGTVLGLLAGYFGGWTDTVIMRIVDIRVAFPFYVLVIALVFVLGPGERSIYIAITAVGWVGYARIIRGEILVAKRQDYVTAARSGGLSNMRIMRRHLLPNVITQAFIYSMSDIIQDILAVVTLGYFGLGVPPPTADLGSMINDGQNILSTHWQLSTMPGLAVVIVGLGLSLTGDGLADLLRPGQ